MGSRLCQDRQERIDLRHSIETLSIDEERRSAVDSRAYARIKILANALRVSVTFQIVDKPARIEAECRRVSNEILGFEGTLVFEKHIVHLPEFALGAGGLRRFGRLPGVWMHVGERKISK